LILKTEQDLHNLNGNKYYLFPNYKGTPSFMLFIKIYDNYYNCIIDKIHLKCNMEKLDLNLVNIIPVKVPVCEDIYEGTIFEGVLNNSDGEDRPIFYIDNVIYLHGDDVSTTKIYNKNIHLTSYLERCYKDDKLISNVILKINKIFELEQIRDLEEFINNKTGIKGITFYPDCTGIKLLYIDRDNIKTQNNARAPLTNQIFD